MAGRLYRMAKVVSANPASWGIVDANQISGFRTVATQADLYSIAACILSSSYGDDTTTGADAVGQIWHVQEGNDGNGKDFRLINWSKRGSAEGWREEIASELLVARINGAEDKADNAINKADTNADSISELKTAVGELNTAVDKKADSSRVDIIADSVNSNTGDIVDIKNKLAKKADLVNGKLDPEQLPDIDTTLYELAPNNTLPSTLADINKNHIYLVKAATAGTNNVYAEYIYTGTSATYDATKWEKLGEVSAKVDLSGYATTTYVQNVVSTAKHDVKPDTVNFTKHTDTTDLDIDIRNSDGTKLTKPVSIPLVNIDNNTNGLMSPTMLTKLDGLNNYTHPTRNANALGTEGLYKITVDDLGHVSKTTTVSKDDIKSLAPDLTMSAAFGTDQVNVTANYGGVDKIARLTAANENYAGIMSKAMYTKLAGIAEGATNNAVVNKVESTGTDAVSGKAVYTAINTHKINNNNLSSTSAGNTYSILGKNDSEVGEVGALVDTLTYQYDATDHSTLSIDGAAVWDEVTLTAISNDELTKILA